MNDAETCRRAFRIAFSTMTDAASAFALGAMLCVAACGMAAGLAATALAARLRRLAPSAE